MANPSRFIPHDNLAPILHDVHDVQSMSSAIREALIRDLPRVIDHSESHSVDIGSIYIGLEGTVVLNDYISSMKSLAISTSGDTSNTLLIRSAHAYGGKIPSVKYGARSSFLETSTGIAILVLIAEERNARSGTFSDLVPLCTQNLQNATRVALQNEGGDPDDGCEVLYGRAGLLYALLLLHRTCEKVGGTEISHLYSDETLHGLVKEVLRRGQLGAAAYAKEYRGSSSIPALMWSWHGKRYLGGAHGVVGILQMLVSSPIHIIEPYMPLILNTTEWVLSLQDREGNWPPKAPGSDHMHSSDLVHWCHGAPATLIYLSSLYRRQDISQQISHELRLSTEQAMKRGAHLVYSQGLLRKGVGLCHGIGGSVFALLSVSRAFASTSRTEAEGDLAQQQSMEYLRQAAHLALVATHWQELTQKGEMRLPDHPWSLYEGLAGMCAAWAAVVEKVSGGNWSGMPGYELD